MNYKEKYEEALEKARVWKEKSGMPVNKQGILDDIFPELKESEDEKIRKELISFITDRKNWFPKEETKASWIAWLEKQSEPQVRTGSEWVRTIDDACEYRYAEEYAHGEYCHEQSFRWGFQEGVDWLEKQGEQRPVDKIQIGKKYKCIVSPRYSTFMIGQIYKPEDKFLCSLMNFCSDCFEPIEDGEQSPANKVEPKFKKGDWVINGHGFVMNIVDVQDSHYVYVYEGKELTATIEQMEDSCHLWTIQDAKDGDILATHLSPEGDWIGIYKESVDILSFKTYCFLNGVGEFVINPNRCRNHGTHGLHPATKEQRDLLFQKMKEAGYKWDVEKKELKKIKSAQSKLPNGKDYGKDSLYHAVRIFEKALDKNRLYKQKPASITDEWIEDYWQHKKVNNPNSYDKGDEIQFDHDGFVRFCNKYLQKPAWNEGDEKILETLINDTEKTLFAIKQEESSDIMSGLSEIYIERLRWLKSLKERIKGE